MHNIKKILCFGDSLTEGWINGGKAFHSYTKRLADLLNKQGDTEYKVINAGLSGEKVYCEMFERLPKVLKEQDNVDMLILQGGTNDILCLLDLRNSLNLCKEFEKLIEVAKEFKVPKVCFMSTMEGYYTERDDAVMPHEESNSYRIKLNEHMRQFASKNDDLIFCDMEKMLPLFSLNDANRLKMWDDNIHPSINGYNKMAEIVYEHIKRYI